jgi:hypothetical protein
VSGCSKLDVEKLNLFNYLVGAGEQRGRYGEAERFRGFEVNHQINLDRLVKASPAWLRV